MFVGDDSQKEDWKCYDWEFYFVLIEVCGLRNLLFLYVVLYDKYLCYQMLVFIYCGVEVVEEYWQMFDVVFV